MHSDLSRNTNLDFSDIDGQRAWQFIKACVLQHIHELEAVACYAQPYLTSPSLFPTPSPLIPFTLERATAHNVDRANSSSQYFQPKHQQSLMARSKSELRNFPPCPMPCHPQAPAHSSATSYLIFCARPSAPLLVGRYSLSTMRAEVFERMEFGCYMDKDGCIKRKQCISQWTVCNL